MLYGELPRVIQRFMREHPGLDVVLTELTSVQQAEALQAGRIDVGFGRVAITTDGLVNTLIQEEPMVAALPADSPLAKAKTLTLKALAEQTVILYPASPRPSFADQVLTQFRAHGFPLTNVYETNGLQTAVGLVAAGVGVSIVPASVQRLKRDDLTYRSVAQQTLVSPMLMTTREGDLSKDLMNLCSAVQAACAVTVGTTTASPNLRRVHSTRRESHFSKHRAPREALR